MIVIGPIEVRIPRMDRRPASRNAARVFHQMPTMSHLDGVKDRPARSLTVSAAAIKRDNPDPGCLESQSLHGGRFPIRQQRHDPPSLQITYDCPVTVIPAEGPVIDTHNDQRIGWHDGTPSHDPQQGIITNGQHESLGKACCRSSAECQAEMMDNALQPRRTTRPDRNNMVSEPLSKDLPAAIRHVPNEPPCDHSDAYLLAGAGQIGNLSKVATVNSARNYAAQGTIGGHLPRMHSQNYRIR